MLRFPLFAPSLFANIPRGGGLLYILPCVSFRTVGYLVAFASLLMYNGVSTLHTPKGSAYAFTVSMFYVKCHRWGAVALSTGSKIVTQFTFPTHSANCLLLFHKAKGGNPVTARGVGDVFFFGMTPDESGGACHIVGTGGETLKSQKRQGIGQGEGVAGYGSCCVA